MPPITDTTKPDHSYALKSLKQFIGKNTSPHFKWGVRRYILWPLDYALSHLFRRKKRACILKHWNGVGLGCYLDHMLKGIAYADRKNMIPVVDMQTYPNTYLNDDEVGRVNSWEYFFAQPAGMSLDEALSMKDTITREKVNLLPSHGHDKDFFCNYLGQLTYWKKIARKCIRFTPAVTERLERMKAKYDGMKILGVLVRGTDYVALRPKNHPIPPTPEQAIAKAREAMSEKNFDAVYLATEDKRIAAKFQEAFGEKLILPEADYLDYDYSSPKYLAEVISSRPNDKYLRGLDYLVSMLFLSRCEGFIASGNNGSVVAMLFSDGFEYFYFFDLGVYQ